LNAALAASAACAAATALPGEMRMLGAALVVLVLPGLAWSGLFRATPLSPARLAVAVIGLSAISLSGGLAVGAVFAPPPSPWPFLVWTLVATNLGAVWSGGLPKLDPGRPWLALGAVALAGFLATAGAALRLVPPLEDHDMEVRGTAYGLASDLKPYFTSNREQFLPMSHPLLFNAIVTGTLLVTHEIDAVKPSYDSAKRAEEAARNGAPFSWEASWRSDYEAFLARPALAGTRAASALFAGLVLALIVDALLRLTGSAAAAGAGAFLYAAAPETIVRSAYAGYFAETVFAMLVAAMVLGEDDAGRAWPAAAGALMALLDHKTAVFAGAVAAWAAALALRTRQAPDARAIALALGFGAGTLGWWAYGLWVSPRAFVDDHIRKHLVHRFLLNDVRFAADHVNRYAPSIPELWREFAAHTGWTLVPIAVLASIAALVRPGSAVATALAVWFLSGAVAFSLTDWRQTKHLMNGLAPMVILAVAAAWPLVRWRRLTAALLLAACLANLAIDRKLLADFHSLRVSGASDIDGW
jgi:hypothetical protein